MINTRRQAMRGGVVRCSLGVLVTALLLAGNPSGGAVADDKEKDEKKPKYDLPKLPKECGKPEWDLSAVEERLSIAKGSVDDNGRVYFLLELKEDSDGLGAGYSVFFLDKDGGKVTNTSANFVPTSGKKGDKVRLIMAGYPVGKSATADAMWAKSAKIKYTP